MTIALIILLACILAMLIGIFTGKNLPEKLMSYCCLNNYIIILLVMFSLFAGRGSFVDIAYIYALLGCAVNLAIYKISSKS